MNKLQFFMPMEPPTATAQEKQSTIVNGKRCFYKNYRLQVAEFKLEDGLLPHRPEAPMAGPLHLTVIWMYPATGKHKHGEWRTSKPDTDNLDKLLKDQMTSLGFWKDDAQVVWEDCQKMWTEDTPGVFIRIQQLDPNSGLKRL